MTGAAWGLAIGYGLESVAVICLAVRVRAYRPEPDGQVAAPLGAADGRPGTTVKVVYVVSGTRSGSTVLDTVLGGIDGWFSSGELRFLWERGLLEGRRCGCGEPVTSCPVWSEVLRRPVGSGGRTLGDVHARDVIDWQRDALRVRHTWRLLHDRRGLRSNASLAAYAEVLSSLYAAIADVTGARVIVDSSKHPSDAALLRLLDGVDACTCTSCATRARWRSRGSAARPIRRPGGDAAMGRHGDSPQLGRRERRRGRARPQGDPDRFLRFRYEDLVADPRGSVARIAALAGEPDARLPFVDEHTAELGTNHTVSGNPGRFRTGPGHSAPRRRVGRAPKRPAIDGPPPPSRSRCCCATGTRSAPATAPPEPMRVLILHSRYLSGAASGENRVAEDEAALLAAAGHEVALWSPEPEVGGAVRLARTAAGTVWSPAAVRAVRRRIRERAVDVVHVHDLFPVPLPAVLRGAAAEGAAVVMTLHNYRLMCLPATFLRDGRVCEDCLDHVPWRGVQHRCYRGSAAGSATLAASLTLHRRIGTFGDVHRYVAVSGFVREKYVEAGFPADRVVVKPNFSDAAEPRTDPGEYYLYLGRLSHEKGVDTLLRAWGSAPPGRRLLIVGDGPDGAALRRDAPAGVDFAGQVRGDEVPAILRRARALLVPSRWYEGSAPRDRGVRGRRAGDRDTDRRPGGSGGRRRDGRPRAPRRRARVDGRSRAALRRRPVGAARGGSPRALARALQPRAGTRGPRGRLPRGARRPQRVAVPQHVNGAVSATVSHRSIRR